MDEKRMSPSSLPDERYRDEANFHRPMNKQDRRSESSDEATTRSTTLTNEGSRSSSRVQLKTLYNEAATLCVTLYQALLKSTSPPGTLIT
ncbi:hypothetical protein FHG87_002039 [Trinorchestia longiramus]|nr:hypothetical protein FHG87_002039 [Trinorchestia longiramus]